MLALLQSSWGICCWLHLETESLNQLDLSSDVVWPFLFSLWCPYAARTSGQLDIQQLGLKQPGEIRLIRRFCYSRRYIQTSAMPLAQRTPGLFISCFWRRGVSAKGQHFVQTEYCGSCVQKPHDHHWFLLFTKANEKPPGCRECLYHQ